MSQERRERLFAWGGSSHWATSAPAGVDGSKGCLKITFDYESGFPTGMGAAVKPQAGATSGGLLCFWIKGDGQTARLAVRLIEETEPLQRGIAVISINKDWTYHVLRAEDFGVRGHADPFKARRVSFELVDRNITPHVADGKHTIWVDHIGTAPHPFPEVGNMGRNPFPLICGRACPAFCEAKCRRGDVDESIAIRMVKRFMADQEIARPWTPERIEAPKEQRVAVIGAGPAGLTAALRLAQRGYGVTVYERAPEAGGMMTRIIPEFKLPKESVRSDIEAIRGLGVEIRTNTAVGKELEKRDMLLPSDIILDAMVEERADIPLNAIHMYSGLKADLYLMRDGDELRKSAFQRRLLVDYGPPIGEVYVHSPEDLILYKLMYLGLSGQPKHARDIVAILKTQKDQLNDEYIEGWVARQGLNSVWKDILDRIP